MYHAIIYKDSVNKIIVLCISNIFRFNIVHFHENPHSTKFHTLSNEEVNQFTTND